MKEKLTVEKIGEYLNEITEACKRQGAGISYMVEADNHLLSGGGYDPDEHPNAMVMQLIMTILTEQTEVNNHELFEDLVLLISKYQVGGSVMMQSPQEIN